MPLCSGITWTRWKDADSNCPCVVEAKTTSLRAISSSLNYTSLVYVHAIFS